MVRGLAGILACVPIALSAAQPSLPKATDLALDGAAMRTAKMPMVVLYSQANCSYCDQARTYLVPMANDPANAQRALFRQIDIDSDTALTDFAGRASTHRTLAKRLDARFTPTVSVLDSEGRALGEPIIGMRLADFYGQYVENAIDEARAALTGSP
jgi:thioredoxin-related protein